MSSDEESYICERCGGTFTKGWSDEEASAEAVQTQNVRIGAIGTALVCDNCYRDILHRMMKSDSDRKN